MKTYFLYILLLSASAGYAADQKNNTLQIQVKTARGDFNLKIPDAQNVTGILAKNNIVQYLRSKAYKFSAVNLHIIWNDGECYNVTHENVILTQYIQSNPEPRPKLIAMVIGQ